MVIVERERRVWDCALEMGVFGGNGVFRKDWIWLWRAATRVARSVGGVVVVVVLVVGVVEVGSGWWCGGGEW